MNDTWTESARRAVDRFLDEARAGLEQSGTDVEEVVADLRRHLEEEAVRRRLTVVTEEDARAILATMGNLLPGPVPPPGPVPMRATGSQSAPGWLQRIAWGMIFLFGVLLPAGTLILELSTHMCSQVLFDPIPGWLEVLAVAVVPLANAIAWVHARRTPFALPACVWCANGAAVAIAAVYALRFLPYTPMACIGVLFYGFGFIPLAPAISLLLALRLRHLLVRRAREASVAWPGGWHPGFWGALLAMVALYLPGPLTRYWASAVDTGSPAQARSALWWLRRAGSERELLGMAYGRLDRAPWDWLNTGGPPAAAARTVYYRVFGRPFNASPPPLGRVGARRGLFDEFEWDNDLGGAAVAGRVTGLSLTQSRIDGRCSADDGWAYHEWILEFRNDHDSQQREARAQIQLPPGGVVSRATLWVNGEEREAAFGGRDQARHAYSEVAVVRRRDPLLVTTCGPDRVLVQCFPIAPRGGAMKIRIGITSPMALPTSNSAVMTWPSLAERNFGLSPQLAHAVWMECLQPPPVAPSGFQLDGHMLHGAPAPPWAPGGAAALAFTRNPAAVQVEARDRHISPETWVRQTVGPDDQPAPSRIALVVDGSIAMAPHVASLARALEAGRTGTEVALWFAGDEGAENATGSLAALAAVLRRMSCEGGRDNAPALAAALGWAGHKPGGVVVWIHGPQPELPRSIDTLNQATLWGGGSTGPMLHDVPVSSAPNRILEVLDDARVRSTPADPAGPAGPLAQMLAHWGGGAPALGFHRVRLDPPVSSDASPSPGLPASSHIVRLWARDEVFRLLRSRMRDQALELARRYQLVTPVSGAVVLETQAQFATHGLAPVSPDTVPTVPEPGVWVLLGLGLLALGGRAARRRPVTGPCARPGF